MGWIGISDHTEGRFNANGLCERSNDKPQKQSVLVPKGTLLVETFLSPDGRPQTLLAFDRSHPWTGSISLKVMPNGGIVLIDTLGGNIRHAALTHALDGRSEQVRVSYRWDAPARAGKLSLEHLATNSIRSVDLSPPHPMQLVDLQMISRFNTLRQMDRDVSFFAVSDMIEPIGPMPGLTAEVPIETPYGLVPVSRLKRGDTVFTANGDVVPILQTLKQTVPARGCLRPILLRAPFFGLSQDILLAPQQRLVVSGSQVEYMFGTEAASVPVRHLVNGACAYHPKGPDLVTYHHLLLPKQQTIVAAGCPMESMYIGRIRRNKEQVAASILANFDRSRLPEHAPSIWPVLKPLEAMTLAIQRAA